MNQIQSSNNPKTGAKSDELKKVALRLQTLSSDKKQVFREALKKRGIDPWKLPLVPIDRERITDLPLSFAQQRLWVLDQIEKGSSNYHIGAALELNGSININAIDKSFSDIVQRHESLRTCFQTSDDGKPFQVIKTIDSFGVKQHSLALSDNQQLEALSLLKEFASKPFDLSQDLMLRVQLIKLSERKHILQVVMHHIASDGWSLPILINEFIHLYRGYINDQTTTLPTLPIQYVDYAHWQRDWLQGADLEEQLNYWRKQLTGLPVVHNLPLDKERPEVQTFNGTTLTSRVGAPIVERLKSLCQKVDATLFMGLHAAFSVLLSRYSGEEDIIVGSPSANREQQEIAGLIGFFVSTLVLRSDVSGDPNFEEMLQRSRQCLMGAYTHQQVPFEQIVEDLQPQRSLSHSPLFQVMLVLQNNETGDMSSLDGLQVSSLKQEQAVAKYDLTLVITEQDDSLELIWEYNTDLFEVETIDALSSHFNVLLDSLSFQPKASVFSAQMLPVEEQQTALNGLLNTDNHHPIEHSLPALFEQQVQLTPNATAISFAEQSLTYQELDEQANQLAHYLIKEHSVNADSLIGLCTQRSIEMVVGALATLKAGGAYMPLDPNYPADRLVYMLEHSQANLVLNDTFVIEHDLLPQSGYQSVNLTDYAQFASYAKTPVQKIVKLNDLAYVIYTSGSTGKPKGVQVTHSNLSNFISSMKRLFLPTAQDQLLAVTSLSFDIAALELYLPLVSGAQVVLADEDLAMDGERLRDTLETGISMMQATPVTWKLLLSANWQHDSAKSFTALCGGEAFPTELAQRLIAQPINLWNMYGPTETTVWSSVFELSKKPELIKGSVPVGHPIDNTTLCVLDTKANLMPVGAVGELYIGGEGVTRGYLHQDDLTQERFIELPQGRFYQTGDLARYRRDGVLECLGRIDNQVKVRGYRIELGEIEHCLVQHQDIVDIAVNPVIRTGEPVLVAYVVSNNASKETQNSDLIESLRTLGAAHLPEYMVPAIYVTLDALPLTPNGKVDRKALPEPDMSIKQVEYVAPQTDNEILLSEIWQSVLNVDRVGVHDNFFELGGHSLLVIQIISRLQEKGIEANVRDIFKTPRLLDLAKTLDANGGTELFCAPKNLIPDNVDVITPDMLPLVTLTQDEINSVSEKVPGGVQNIADIYPLGPLQEGIYFHYLLNQENDPYIFTLSLAVDDAVVLKNLVSALQFMVNRHDVLRTLVVSDGVDQPVQVVCRSAELQVEWLELDNNQDIGKQVQALAEPGQQSMDLSQAPLLKLSVAKETNSERHHVLLQYHHLISDHEGLDIIQRELAAYFAGMSDILPAPIAYREFVAHAQHQLKQGDAKAFFTHMLSGVDEPSLPFGLVNTQSDGRQINDCRQALPEDVANRLRIVTKQRQISPASVFHAAWAMVISACSGQDKVVFGSVLSGRLQGTVGAQHMMGVFINTLPIRIDLDERNVSSFVTGVHESLTDLLSYEQTPLVLAQNASDLPADQPLFSALMNYRHSGTPNDNEETLAQKAQGIELIASAVRNSYPLTMSVDDLGDNGFGLAGLFDSSVNADQVLSYMQKAVSQLVNELEQANQTRAINTLSIISDEEHDRLLNQHNNKQQEFDLLTPVHQLFEQLVLSQAEATALISGARSLSYAELNAQANQLAHYLQSLGINSDTPVALYMERTPSLIIALLAVLKAGGCYVPLDTNWPRSRVKAILSDAKIDHVLSDKKHENELESLTQDIHYVGAQETQWNNCSTCNPNTTGSLNDAAYVIYTSGSTGQPKGVVVEHRHLLNYLWALNDELNFTGMDFAHISTVAADLGNTGLFGALCFGGCLQLIDTQIAFDPDAVAENLAATPVDAMKIVPGHLQGLLAAEQPENILPKKLLILGGESCPIELIERIWELSPNLKIVNHYGPSETTIGVLTHAITQADIDAKQIPVGKPLPNVQVYVLDKAGQPSPEGVFGELVIGGANTARGYLNNDALTQEKFIENYLSVEASIDPVQSNSKLYYTGDRVYRRPDGAIVFLGRIDSQVKVRGYRVELGDIESCLQKHDDVIDVTARLEVGKVSDTLTAYIASVNTLSNEVLAEYCAQHLPQYMLPQRFVCLEKLPRTENGKVDIKQLASMSAKLTQAEKQVRGASNEKEQALLDIWKEVLRREDFGVDDSFFELGGDSILSLQIIAQAKRAGLQLLPKQLFEFHTISELAGVATALKKDDKKHDELVTGNVVISPIQRWFIQTEHPHATHWNQSLLLEAQDPLDSAALMNAVAYLVRHHDQLRSEFLLDDFIPRQQVLSWELELGERYYHQVNGYQESTFVAQVNDWQAGLSFESDNKVGQLFKVVHFVSQDGGADRLLLVAHHLLVDGVSWRVLMDDLLLAYQHALSEQINPSFPLAKPSFSSKTESFQAWSNKLQSATEDQDRVWQQSAQTYWRNMAKKLPADHDLIMPKQQASLAEVESLNVRLDKAQTQALLQSAPKAYKTGINDLLLSALSLAVNKQVSLDRLYLDLEGHGRESLDGLFEHSDVSRTVGWFTSRFPVLLTSEDQIDLGILIQSVKEQLRTVPSNGMSYGVLSQLGDLVALPNPLISFNYLGQTDNMQQSTHGLTPLGQLDGVIERSLENKVTHALSINAVVSGETLNIDVQSVATMLPLKVEQFVDDLLGSLTQIIEHCGDELRALTPSDFPAAKIDQTQLNELTDKVGLHQLQDVYGMTSLQEGMLFHTLMTDHSELNETGSAYFNQLRINFTGMFDLAVFEQSWQLMFERHSILRTSFWPSIADEPVQVVNKDCEMSINIIDVSDKSALEQGDYIEQFMQQDRLIGFDLQQPPLMRATVFKLSEQHWQLLWSRHHLLLDGWSSTRLIQEVMSAYQALSAGAEPSDSALLSNKAFPYRRYIDWLQSQDNSKGLTFWQQYLAQVEQSNHIALTRNDSGYRYVTHALPVALSKKLDQLAKRNQVTLNSVMQAAWGLLLSRYRNDYQNSTVLFGMTTAGRPSDLAGSSDMLGLFINTLPICLQVDSTTSVTAFLQNVQRNQVDARDYEHISLTQIQALSSIKNGQSLFDSLLVFENYYVDQDAKQQLQQGNDALDIQIISSQEPTNYPVTLSVVPNIKQGIELRFTTHDVEEHEFDLFVDYFSTILERLGSATEQTSLTQLTALSKEQNSIGCDVDDSFENLFEGKGIEQLFSKQASINSQKIAARFDDQSISYQELEAKSNQLAHLLQTKGVGAGSLVGVAQQRSLSLLVSVLGVMKAGAAYVPLDPSYPLERLHYMVNDSGLSLLLCDQAVSDGQLFDAESSDYSIINVSHDDLLASQPDSPVSQSANVQDLAYVIYTSGSTGFPKGVQITRANLSNFINGMQNLLKPTSEDCFLAVTSLSFDIATLELYLPLVVGAEVIIGDEGLSMDGQRLCSVIESGVTIMQATPVTWKLLLSAGWPELTSKLTVLCGGEAFPTDLAKQLLSENTRVFNMYGPTETTVWSTACELKPDVITNTVPIGQAIDNTSLYILDNNHQPMPTGVAGELYIGGAGVARGYLGNPQLTKERFIDFNGQRIYQTGDLARYRRDSVLECLGRLDNQVKIRGFRIELGEIEQCLLSHNEIKDAVVTPYQHNDEALLVAYVIRQPKSDSHSTIELSGQLKEHVGQRLPGYMIPSFVITLDEFPLTPNGKIDRKALPEPLAANEQRQYIAPRSDIETDLCVIWQQVLGIEKVGIDDDFFELGGHSLTAIRLQAQIGQQFGIQLALRDLFERNSVRDVAEQLELQLAANIVMQTVDERNDAEQNSDNDADDIEEFEL